MYILPEKIFSILTATIPAGGVLNTNCMMYTKGKDPQPKGLVVLSIYKKAVELDLEHSGFPISFGT
jgi:hypothetical protein